MGMRRPGWQREKLAWKAGELLCGVDEVGTGAWAGPVYAGAVVFTEYVRVPILCDSKQLPELERESAAVFLKQRCIWAVGRVSVEELAEMGLRQATYLAMRRAVQGLGLPPTRVVIDALTLPDFPFPQEALIRADAQVASVAAAAILAKVHRDAEMRELDRQFPGYGFGTHKGYGTAAHTKALHRLGVSAVHRKNYAPISKILAKKV